MATKPVSAGSSNAIPATLPAAKDKKTLAHGKGNITVDQSDQYRNGNPTELETQMIEGRIFKPSVFYVLARSSIAYTGIEIPQNFTDRIMKGALKRPF